MSDAKIIVRPTGSYKIEGGIPLFDNDGNRIPTPEDRPYSLCRCGHSKNKPFCDASHKTCAWDPTLASQS